MLDSLPVKTVDGAPDSSSFPYKTIGSDVQCMGRRADQVNRLRLLEERLAKHQERATEIEQAAYEESYAVGEKAGLELGGRRAEQIMARMRHVLDEGRGQLDEIREHACCAIMDISGAIAEWLVGEITGDDRMRLLQMARKAAGEFPETEHLKIALHPDDLAHIKRLPADSGKVPPLVSDASMARGSVRIFSRSRDALLDPHACIDDFIKRFKAELKGTRTTESTKIHGDTQKKEPEHET